MVSPAYRSGPPASGRIFYILEDSILGVANVPERWFLYARDAFNGTLLWKKPIEQWLCYNRSCRPFQAKSLKWLETTSRLGTNNE